MRSSETSVFLAKAARVEVLIGEIESAASPALRDRIRELVQNLLDVHGAALERMLDEAYEARGSELIDRMASDELVRPVLLLHGLHPASMEERVLEALDSVRPYLNSHGGNVELLEVRQEGHVVLRLDGSCSGCPSSSATLKNMIEKAIYASAPDVSVIELGERGDDRGFIRLNTVEWDDCPFPSDISIG